MSKPNVVDPRFEEFIAMKCASFANLEYQCTPELTRYDFQLQDSRDIKVLAEIKTRNDLYPDWFVEDNKSEWLIEASKLFRCAPWYVIHCEVNRVTYQLNLNFDFKSRRGAMYGEAGVFVRLDEWNIIPKLGSPKVSMSPLDWK